MRRFGTTICAILATFVASADALSDSASELRDPAYSISMVQLIVDPKHYEGKRVEVVGYLRQVVNPTLFLNRISADTRDFASSILLVDPSKEWEMSSVCGDKYVKIVGRVMLSREAFELANIEKVEDAKLVEPCWEAK